VNLFQVCCLFLENEDEIISDTGTYVVPTHRVYLILAGSDAL